MERFMGKARLKKPLTDWRGDARLYEMTPAYLGAQFVVVSKVAYMSVRQTYIFAADEHGAVIDWRQMRGSKIGTHSHEHVLTCAGYETQ